MAPVERLASLTGKLGGREGLSQKPLFGQPTLGDGPSGETDILVLDAVVGVELDRKNSNVMAGDCGSSP